MQTRGSFKFRGLQKVEAGTFTDDNGKELAYDASYKLKVDEMTDMGIQERVFKLKIDSDLLPKLVNLKPYDDIILDFNIQFYGSGCRLIPVNLVKDSK